MFAWMTKEGEDSQSLCSKGRDVQKPKGKTGQGRRFYTPSSRSGQNLLGIAIVLAILIIVVVHVTVLPFNEVVPTRYVSQKVWRDYEQSLCSMNINALSKERKRRKCPKNGIVTVNQGGRLGNQMWEYASVWAVARRTGLEPFVPTCLLKVLDEAFVDLSVSDLGQISHCPVVWQDVVSSPEQWTRLNQSIVLPRFAVLPEAVLTWVSDIRKEFQFKRDLTRYAEQLLRGIAQNRQNLTFVGVHVRRTDYIFYLWRTRRVPAASEEFFTNAMDYFRLKYQNPIFIVLSDDPGWCRDNLGSPEQDVYVVSFTDITTPAQDLATMSACNHSIVDYGTFGVWGAILTGGETLVYNMTRHSSLRVAELLPQWQVFTW